MEVAVVVGVVSTIIALVGLLGRSADGLAKPSQIVVMALPLGIIAGGVLANQGVRDEMTHRPRQIGRAHV